MKNIELEGILFEAREIAWLAKELLKNQREYNFFPSSFIDTTNDNDVVVHAIKSEQHKNLVLNLLNNKQQYLIPTSSLDWIKKDNQRLLIFLILKLPSLINKYEHHTLSNPLITPTESRYDRLITTFDTLNGSIQNKLDILGKIKTEWNETSIPSKKIEWINRKDPIQVQWAYNYLISKGHTIFVPKPTENEMYHHTLAILDQTPTFPHEVRSYLLDQMRKAWSQIKYRKSENVKKQISVSLPHNTIKKLEKLTKEKGKRKNQIIEILINKASEDTTLLD